MDHESLQRVPDAASLENAINLEIHDEAGNSLKFGSLFEDRRTIIVFIRHFFCGTCQAYVTQLASVPKEALVAANTHLVIIGCGEWKAIRGYKETTGFVGDIYADSSRTLYHALGMTITNLDLTPKDQKKRSYVKDSYLHNVFSSILKGPIKQPLNIGKQGNISQLGGEFIFGPGSQCTFASRMQHTEDHMEVSDLVQKAGVAYP